jgi:hypothetical protein
MPKFLTIFTVLKRWLLLEVIIGIATIAPLSPPVRLETVEVSLVGVSVATADSRATSSAVVKHERLAASVRRLSVEVLFVIWVLIFLRLTGDVSLLMSGSFNDHEFLIIMGLSMVMPLVD